MESELADLVERDKPFEEQAAEQGCKNPHRQEEGGTRSDPSRSVPRETAAWDDHVQMRMMGHRRAPGVKDGGEADAGAEMVRVCGNRRHRLRGRPEQEIVDGPLVLEGDCRDFGWQREDDVEVSDRQEVSLSCFQPITGRRTLAARAMPVAAGVVSDPQMAAVVAAFDVSAEGCGAACDDRRHHLQFGQVQMSEAGCLECGACTTEDVGEFNPGSHRLSRVRPFDFRTARAGRAD